MKKLRIGDKFHSPHVDMKTGRGIYTVVSVGDEGYVVKDHEGTEGHSFETIHNLFKRGSNPWVLKRAYHVEFKDELFEL